MATVFLALGSNLGDREGYLRRARLQLQALPGVKVTAVSALYETAPAGGPPGQGPYLNAVLELSCELPPRDLLARCQELEERAGRVRQEPGGPRTLDLDLLLYDDLETDAPELTLPHPRLHRRAFVLRPLADLAPGRRLPGRRETVAELLDTASERSSVRLIQRDW